MWFGIPLPAWAYEKEYREAVDYRQSPGEVPVKNRGETGTALTILETQYFPRWSARK